MYSTAYNLWTFTWFVHFELSSRLKWTEKIHTERFFKFPSNIYSILYDCTLPGPRTRRAIYQLYTAPYHRTLQSQAEPGSHIYTIRNLSSTSWLHHIGNIWVLCRPDVFLDLSWSFIYLVISRQYKINIKVPCSISKCHKFIYPWTM